MKPEADENKLGPPYPYPPITEAVIELRFDSNVDKAMLEKISKKFSTHYPNASDQTVKEIKVDLEQEKVEIENSHKAIRRSNDLEDEVAMLRHNSFTISQMPIYQGWDEFFSRFLRDWDIWAATVGYQKIIRVGLRYINRIDIPNADDLVRHEDYLSLEAKLPKEYPHNTGYMIQVQIPANEILSLAMVKSGTIGSPVPKHAGFLLDIDIGRTEDVPQNLKDVRTLLLNMRDTKNDLFEAFIKDPARDRFFNVQPIG